MISPGMEHMEKTILRSRAFFKLHTAGTLCWGVLCMKDVSQHHPPKAFVERVLIAAPCPTRL